MAIHLVVRVPFWDYAHGDKITDPDEIEKVLMYHSHFVTQVKATNDVSLTDEQK